MKEERLRELEKIGVKSRGEIVIPEKASDWIEKQEKERHFSSQPKKAPIVTDDQGQTILAPSSLSTQSTISPPLTTAQMAAALKQKTSNTIRWLAEWYRRIMKIKTLNKSHGSN